MTKNRENRPARWKIALLGDETTTRRFPVLNKVILWYVGATLAIYVLFLIAPFVTFLAGTPFYHVQSALGALGGVLLCVDLVTNRVLWRGPYCLLLYVSCALALLASALTVSYGVKDNLFIIAWTVIQFALFYSAAWRMEREELERFAGRVYAAVMPPWLVACCVSVYQFVFQIGYLYVVDPRADDLSLARQGFLESRLFGVFNPLNHASYVSLMLMAIGVYFAIRTKKKAVRVALIIADVVFFLHVILSGSRSAEVSLLACALFGGFIWARGRMDKPGLARALKAAGAGVVVCGLCLLIFTGAKAVLARVPGLMQTAGLLPEQVEPLDEDILDRMGLEDNASNNRFTIWKDYVDLRGEIGLVGLSPGNYMSVIREKYPDMYIVKYIRELFPEKYEAGSIYHVHNGYLMAYVSSGLVGLLCVLAFLVLCCRKTIRYLLRVSRTPWGYTTLCFLVGMGCIAAVFDKALFFMDSAPTFIFWVALGLLMRVSGAEDTTR